MCALLLACLLALGLASARESEKREREGAGGGDRGGKRERRETCVCTWKKSFGACKVAISITSCCQAQGFEPTSLLSHLRERKKECVLWFLSKGLEPRTLRLGARTEKGNNNKKERRRRKRRRHGGWVMKQR